MRISRSSRRWLSSSLAALSLAAWCGCVASDPDVTLARPAGSISAPGGATAAAASALEPVLPVDLLALPPKRRAIDVLRPKPGFKANLANAASTLVVYDPRDGWARTGSPDGALEAMVRDGEVVSIGTRGDTPVPRDGFVVAGLGDAAEWVRVFAAKGRLLDVADGELRSREGFDERAAHYRKFDAECRARLANARVGGKIDGAQLGRVDAHLAQASTDWALAQGAASRCQSLVSVPTRPPGAAARIQSERKDAFAALGQAFARTELAAAILAASPKTELRVAWHRVVEEGPAQLRLTIDKMAATGFNVLVLDAIYDGGAVYPTSRAADMLFQHERFRGWDPLSVAVTAAHEKGMLVFASVDVFSLGSRRVSPILQREPGWLAVSRGQRAECAGEAEAVYLSPSSDPARDWALANARELATLYGVDGLHLETIRYPRARDANDEFDFGPAARAGFIGTGGPDPAGIAGEAPEQAAWRDYREDRVTSMAQAIRQELRRVKPELMLSATVWPADIVEKGRMMQNWGLWCEAGLLDWAVLAADDARDFASANRRAAEARKLVPGEFPLALRIASPDRISSLDLADCVNGARDGGASGVGVLFFSEMLPGDLQAMRLGAFRTKAGALKPPAR